MLIRSCTSLPLLAVEGENASALPPPYLLRHNPGLTSLLGVTQGRHAAFDFPPERLLGGSQGGHPARGHDNKPRATSWIHRANSEFAPATAPAAPVAKHRGRRSLTSGSTTRYAGRDADIRTHTLHGPTRLPCCVSHATHSFLVRCLPVTSPHNESERADGRFRGGSVWLSQKKKAR